MADRSHQTAQRPTPRAYPTAPLNPTAQAALTRLELRLTHPTDLYRAVTRYTVASEHTAQLSARLDRRDLTPAEFDSFQYAQDVMRESRTALATAGRLDLIGATA